MGPLPHVLHLRRWDHSLKVGSVDWAGLGSLRKGTKKAIALAGATVFTTLVSYLVTQVIGDEPPPPPPKRTEVRIWRPSINGELGADLDVISSENGDCVFPSGSNPSNPQAVRCFGEKYVLDPCWPDSAHKAVCPLKGPWSKEVIVLRVREIPPVAEEGPSVEKSRPWAIELANGSRCLAISGGAWDQYPGPTGQPPSFVCGQDESDDLVYELDTKGQLWTAAFAPQGSTETKEVPVRIAWR